MAPRRVLLVEDESLIRSLAAMALQEAGFDVVEAWNGDQAVGLIDQLCPLDILVTDVQMPGVHDGVAVACYARLRQADIPVLVVSGYTENVRARLAELVPAAVVLTKPYKSDRMVELCRQMTLAPFSALATEPNGG